MERVTKPSSLRQYIPPIHHDIAPRRKRRRITRQIQINTLNLPDMALPPQHGHPMCLILHPLRRTHLRLKEARTHHVNPRKRPPLPRQRLAQLRDRRLGRVVDGLIDGYVDDVRRDAARDDQVAVALALKDRPDVLRAVEDAVDVDGHLRAVLVQRLLEDGLRDRRAGVSDEDV